jgi:hypothetical protein
MTPFLVRNIYFSRSFRLIINITLTTALIYQSQDGEPSKGPEDFPRPEGWKWISKEWTVDLDRAVDEDGWEYSESETFGGIYVKAVKPFHMTRQRRWICSRELVDPSAERKQVSNMYTQLVSYKIDSDKSQCLIFHFK